MNKFLFIIFFTVQIFCLQFSTFQSWAQNGVSFTANGPEKMGLHDQAEIIFTIENAGGIKTESNLVLTDAVITQGPYKGTVNHTEIMNGKVNKYLTYTISYVIKPKHLGCLKIPSLTAKDGNGHTFSSNPLTIKVVANSQAQQQAKEEDEDPFAAMNQQIAAMQQQANALMQQQMKGNAYPQSMPNNASPDELKNNLFIKVAVDKNKVKIGEQLTASYKLYYRLFDFQRQITKLPTLNGFWVHNYDIPNPPSPEIEELNGQRYNTILLKKVALFPQQTGELIIDPIEVSGAAYAYDVIPFNIKSNPVSISVLPLQDAQKHSNFTGAVGSFSLQQNIDKTDLTTDEVAKITYTISGTGNIKLFDFPKPAFPKQLNSYEPQITDTILSLDNQISGYKKITYTLAPHEAGNFTIPSHEFIYFDVASNSYKTLHTDSIKLHVTQGINVASNTLILPKKSFLNSLAPLPTTTLTANHYFIVNPLFWLLILCTIIGFLGYGYYQNQHQNKQVQAQQLALNRLALAHQFLQKNQTTSFYEETSKAIWLYLSHTFKIPLSTLSKEVSFSFLDKRKIPPNLVQKTQQVINDCEYALYAPTEDKHTLNSTYHDAIEVISNLEKHLKNNYE